MASSVSVIGLVNAWKKFLFVKRPQLQELCSQHGGLLRIVAQNSNFSELWLRLRVVALQDACLVSNGQFLNIERGASTVLLEK